MSDTPPPTEHASSSTPAPTGSSPPADHVPGGDTGETPPPIVVPTWVSSDWGTALRIAGVAHALLLAAACAIALVALLQQLVAVGFDEVSWGAMSLSPLLVVLGWLGGGAGEPILVTGLLYLYLAYRWAFARSSSAATLVADRVRTFAVAVKVGLVSAAALLVVGILLNSLAGDLIARSFSPWVGVRIDLTVLVFTCIFLGSAVALLALLASVRTTLARLLGLTVTLPPLVRAGLAGGRRTLLVAAVGVLSLASLGAILDALTRDGSTVATAFDALLGTLVHVAVAGVDRAILLVLGAAKFLHGGGFVWAPFGEVAAWMWLSLPILIGAYVAGGIVAARAGSPRTQAEAARTALLVGPVVAAVGFLVSLGWAGQPYLDDLIPIAILVPSLWGVVAAGSAWIWANQQGLPGGLVIERAGADASPEAATDPNSGPPHAPAPAPDTTAPDMTATAPTAPQTPVPGPETTADTAAPSDDAASLEIDLPPPAATTPPPDASEDHTTPLEHSPPAHTTPLDRHAAPEPATPREPIGAPEGDTPPGPPSSTERTARLEPHVRIPRHAPELDEDDAPVHPEHDARPANRPDADVHTGDGPARDDELPKPWDIPPRTYPDDDPGPLPPPDPDTRWG